MIIVEGPDGAGKTTLVNDLIDQYDIPKAARFATSTGGPLPNMPELVLEDLQCWPRAVIYDRHAIISGQIYGPVIKGHPDLEDQLQFFMIYRQIMSFNPLVIWCLPPIETVRQNVMKDEAEGDSYAGVLERIDLIYQMYTNWAVAHVSANGLIYDYSSPFAELQRREIGGLIERIVHPSAGLRRVR